MESLIKNLTNTSKTLKGISFLGDTIRTNCNQLSKLFGDYQSSDKVNYEWELIIDDIPFSIYDWKEPWLDEYTIIDYHIGARNPKESKFIADLINTYLKSK